MTPRLLARGQRRTPTTDNRSRGLVELVTHRVRLSHVRGKGITSCRALLPCCPHLGSWPQVLAEPLLQAGHSPEVGKRLARQHSVDGEPIDARFALHSPQRQSLPLQGGTQSVHERLGVPCAGRSGWIEVPGRPLALRDVRAGSGVTSGPRHGLRLPIQPCGVCAPCYGSGYYNNHSGEPSCRAISSSGARS